MRVSLGLETGFLATASQRHSSISDAGIWEGYYRTTRLGHSAFVPIWSLVPTPELIVVLDIPYRSEYSTRSQHSVDFFQRLWCSKPMKSPHHVRICIDLVSPVPQRGCHELSCVIANSSHLCSNACITPVIANWHFICRPLDDFCVCEILLREFDSHTLVRLNGLDVEPLMACCQQLGELASPRGNLDNPGVRMR